MIQVIKMFVFNKTQIVFVIGAPLNCRLREMLVKLSKYSRMVQSRNTPKYRVNTDGEGEIGPLNSQC